MTERIPGVDTIRGLSGTPPMVNVIPYRVMEVGESLRQVWNSIYIAFIPYCFKCKVPLDWHTPPDGHKVFTCPNCNRQWVLGGRNDRTKKDTKTAG